MDFDIFSNIFRLNKVFQDTYENSISFIHFEIFDFEVFVIFSVKFLIICSQENNLKLKNLIYKNMLFVKSF